ncbi:MAG: TPM domain-containing protein [Pseudooceanicola sp.]|nr:TPM domain-containing protein [Pseudooceanicola sp.]
MLSLLRLAALALLFAGPATAQTFPAYKDIFVNDEAGILSDAAEADLRSDLEDLRSRTGIEMTVLTLKSQRNYAPTLTMENFATQLFNTWGVGAVNRNDGILVLVLRQDRAMRIELGKGYARDWQKQAEAVIDRSFLPAFKTYDYEGGIKTGVTDAIHTIALPFHEGKPAPASGGDASGLWIAGAVFGGIAALIGSVFLSGPILARFRKCEACGKAGVTASREVLRSATTYSEGEGRRTLSCPHCGHVVSSLYTISMISETNDSSSGSSGSDSSFGGGSSDGGGASGRW